MFLIEVIISFSSKMQKIFKTISITEYLMNRTKFCCRYKYLIQIKYKYLKE